jgi:hypothetical protein
VVLADDAACAVPTRAEAADALVAEKGVVWVKVRALGRMPAALAVAVASFTAEQEKQASKIRWHIGATDCMVGCQHATQLFWLWNAHFG